MCCESFPVRIHAQDARCRVLGAVGAVALGDATAVPSAVRAAAPHPRRVPESLRPHRPQRAGHRHLALQHVAQEDGEDQVREDFALASMIIPKFQSNRILVDIESTSGRVVKSGAMGRSYVCCYRELIQLNAQLNRVRVKVIQYLAINVFLQNGD